MVGQSIRNNMWGYSESKTSRPAQKESKGDQCSAMLGRAEESAPRQRTMCCMAKGGSGYQSRTARSLHALALRRRQWRGRANLISSCRLLLLLLLLSAAPPAAAAAPAAPHPPPPLQPHHQLPAAGAAAPLPWAGPLPSRLAAASGTLLPPLAPPWLPASAGPLPPPAARPCAAASPATPSCARAGRLPGWGREAGQQRGGTVGGKVIIRRQACRAGRGRGGAQGRAGVSGAPVCAPRAAFWKASIAASSSRCMCMATAAPNQHLARDWASSCGWGQGGCGGVGAPAGVASRQGVKHANPRSGEQCSPSGPAVAEEGPVRRKCCVGAQEGSRQPTCGL